MGLRGDWVNAGGLARTKHRHYAAPVPVIEDEAVCLRQWDWSETSQTVSLFTRGAGLIRCVAKGSKRAGAGAAFSGGVELLSRAHVRIHTKANRDLSILAEWDLAETFTALRQTLADHYVGLYMADCVLHFAADHDAHTGMYDALVGGLRGLGEANTRSLALARFQWLLLSDAGFRPDLAGLDNLEGPVLQFDPQAGGLRGRAADGKKSAIAGQDWRVRRATGETLAAIEAERTGGGPVPATLLPHSARAAALLAAYVRWVLGAQPRSMALVFPDLAATPAGVPGGRKNGPT